MVPRSDTGTSGARFIYPSSTMSFGLDGAYIDWNILGTLIGITPVTEEEEEEEMSPDMLEAFEQALDMGAHA